MWVPLPRRDPTMANRISRIAMMSRPAQRGTASHSRGGTRRSTVPQTPALPPSRKTMSRSSLQSQPHGLAQRAQISNLIYACGRRPHQGKPRLVRAMFGAEASPKRHHQIRIRRPCDPSRSQSPGRRLLTKTAKRSERNSLPRSEEGVPLPQGCGSPSNAGANGFEMQ